MKIQIKKKNGMIVNFDNQKLIDAVNKSAERVMSKLTDEENNRLCEVVVNMIGEERLVEVKDLHKIVEKSLDIIKPEVAKSYREYRNYKTEFVDMLDEAYRRSQSIMFLGDKENSNTDSALVATRRVLSYNEVNRLFYKKFFLTAEEEEAIERGYIYIHDASARRDTYNCCLFDAEKVMKDGFEMGNMWYNEPTDINKALDVLGDIMSVKAGQQYGGLTIPEVDKTLAPYVEKTHKKLLKEKLEEVKAVFGIEIGEESETYKKLDERALNEAIVMLEDGLQGIEYKANSVGSSRGDYPFITFTFGEDTGNFYSRLVASAILKVRKNGQGKKGKKKCVLFPKLVFLYDEAKHGEGAEFEYLFEEAIDCSSVAMYPDFLSLSGDSYVSDIYQKYGKVISPINIIVAYNSDIICEAV